MTEQIGAIRHLRYIFGTATQIELRNFLEVNSIDDEARKKEIRSEWQAAVGRFEELRRSEADGPDSVSTRPLSQADTLKAEKLQGDPVFAITFANYPSAIEEVEIDKLVACQRSVHLEYVDHLAAQFEAKNDNPFDFCLSEPKGGPQLE